MCKLAGICDNNRQICTSEFDIRAQKILLNKGEKYFSKIPFVVSKILTKGNVGLFVDVGANYGENLFALPKGYDAKVIGFEANPELIPYIEKSAEKNDDVKNLTISNKAVSDRNSGSVILHVDSNWSGKSSCVFVPESDDKKEYEVQTVTLDNALSDYYQLHHSLIKIDIQGMEPLALKGASEFITKAPNISVILEFDKEHLQKADVIPESFFDELKETFVLHKLTPRGAYKLNEYSELVKRFPGEDKKKDSDMNHTDLLMVKYSDNQLEKLLDEEFVECDFFKEWQETGYHI